MSEQEVTKSPYPTEVIDLPSKGIFYPEGSPLRSGQIELKYMTAKEEDILTSTNLIQKGIVLDKLMDSLIVTKGVNSSDLLIGDLNAVMVASRILGYGKDYNISISCPRCGNTLDELIDLTKLGTLNEPVEVSAAEMVVVLPISKAEIKFKLLTRQDELEIEKETKALKKINVDGAMETTSRLRAMITSVNGNSSKAAVWTFVENMLVQDAQFLREKYRKFVPDVDFNIEVSCNCNDTPSKVRLPIGANFFWPNSRV
jgi:hypothetical protein